MTFDQPGSQTRAGTTTTIDVIASTTTGRAPARPLWQRVYLGKSMDPGWARPGLLGVLGLAAVLYCWNLSGNGYANTFYAAAVKSGTQSWSSMFFGSLDTGDFITVDKPPFALWVMEISCRIFGFSSVAMLLPIALCGVAAVGVLYSAVRRSFGQAAGLIAAAVCAVTPITVAINRDDNPDPVLVLLMTLGAWFVLESMRTKKLRHLLWAAVMIGCAFTTKTLAGYIVLPALTLVYLHAAEGGFWKRIRNLALFTAVLAAASFWWMLIVDAIPAADRPYVGGSTDDSEWGLATGYNGLGRLTGGDGPGGGGGGGGFSGASGFGRMFNDVLGTQISWLLPAAGLLFVAALVLRGRVERADPERAALLLWGLWLGVHFAVFSFQDGVIHPYYTTAMAPAIGALVGGGGVVVWRAARSSGWAWLVLPITAAVTAYWSVDLLNANSYATWLDPLIIGAAVIGIAALVALRLRPEQRVRLGAVGVAALLVVGLAGPTAFAAAAASSTTSGVNPLAGPSNGSLGGGPGGFGAGGRGGQGGGFGGRPGQSRPSGQAGGLPGDGAGGFGGGPGGFGGPGGQAGGSAQPPSGGGELPGATGFGGTGGAGAAPGGAGGMGSGLSSAEISYLERNQGSAKWLVAVSESSSAAELIVQTGRPVISMFGFTGSDPAMTVAKLEQLVASGELKYVSLGGGVGAGPGGGSGAGAGSDVDTWVQKNCTVVSASEYGAASGSASTSTSTSATASSASGLYACTAKAG